MIRPPPGGLIFFINPPSGKSPSGGRALSGCGCSPPVSALGQIRLTAPVDPYLKKNQKKLCTPPDRKLSYIDRRPLMTILIAGASGATGRLLTRELFERDHNVRIIVRRTDSLPSDVLNHKNLSIIQASVLDLSEEEMARHVKGCNGIASCLGHNMTFKGLFGSPRRLVADSLRLLCRAAKANNPDKGVKVVLMNTTGCRNPDLAESYTIPEKLVIGALRVLLPPHNDNEKASEYLRRELGQEDGIINWAVVRPDNLIDRDEVSPYEIHPSPVRSAIFDPGKTSRINVAHFMADLFTDEEKWNNWRGQTPVIYNK